MAPTYPQNLATSGPGQRIGERSSLWFDDRHSFPTFFDLSFGPQQKYIYIDGREEEALRLGTSGSCLF